MGHLVRLEIKALFTAINIESAGGIKQCKVKLFQYLDGGGYIPAWLVNKKVPDALTVVKEIVDSFQRDEKIDRAALSAVAKAIRDEVRLG